MSHFYTIVVLPGDVDALVAERDATDYDVQQLLAPYDENVEVPKYDARCWCVGGEARRAACQAVQEKFGTWDEIRTQFARDNPLPEGYKDPCDLPEDIADQRQQAWEALVEEIEAYRDQFQDTHPARDVSARGCDECRGTGVYRSTYNVGCRWDWWRYGGRWDGEVRFRPATSQDGGFNFGAHHDRLRNNIISVAEWLENARKDPKTFVPFAIVTPDGRWNQRGQMGWWGIVVDEKHRDDWAACAMDIMQAHKEGHVAIGIDMHI